MITLRAHTLGWITALGLACMPGVALALPPIGSFEIGFGGVLSIWLGDEENDDAFCEAYAGSFGEIESCEFDSVVDGKGKITGWLAFVAHDGATRFALEGPLKGTRRGDGRTGFANQSLTWKLAGELSEPFLTLAIKANLTLTQQIAPGGILTGHWSERYCIQGEDCRSYEADVPAETLTNGNWWLRLEIEDAGGGALEGSASVDFEAGYMCSFALRGRYNAKSDRSSLSLTPIHPGCAGTSLALKNVRAEPKLVFPRETASPIPAAPVESGVAITIFDVKYKLFGYTASTTFVPLPGFPSELHDR